MLPSVWDSLYLRSTQFLPNNAGYLRIFHPSGTSGSAGIFLSVPDNNSFECLCVT